MLRYGNNFNVPKKTALIVQFVPFILIAIVGHNITQDSLWNWSILKAFLILPIECNSVYIAQQRNRYRDDASANPVSP